jgi:hypothetical protein
LSFDLARSLRKFKPERRIATLVRRPEKELPFVTDNMAAGAELLFDTCVYIDNLQNELPDAVDDLVTTRLCNHSGIALSELTHLFGRLDPRDAGTEAVLTRVRQMIATVPPHRLSCPSIKVLGEAGILAGLAARLGGLEPGQALLNDAALFLQAIERGQMLLTRNIREFDRFDQLLPYGRVLFYRTT